MPPAPPLLDRAAKEHREDEDLAPYAMRSAASEGRTHPEAPDRLRTCWERDRDRITHCTAFRRLMYKTQVFVNREGDHNRTRLSHSLEVCQVARSLGSALRLNEPLCEALALAHDIGHPPFGHRGEWALNALMAEHGGFRHNAQVLRVVDQLERRRPGQRGLNLTREVRESLLKHEAAEDWPDEFGARPRQPYLEAQVADLADSTAYNSHDIEDGLRAGMFAEPELAESSALWRRARERVADRHPDFLDSGADDALQTRRTVTELLGICIEDLLASSHAALSEAGLGGPRAVRDHGRPLVRHSPELAAETAELSRFLYRHFYRHPHLQELTRYAARVVGVLFEAYCDRPEEMAPWYQRWSEEVGVPRAVCDYVAGMTDRFAEAEFARFG